eukprot:395109_1
MADEIIANISECLAVATVEPMVKPVLDIVQDVMESCLIKLKRHEHMKNLGDSISRKAASGDPKDRGHRGVPWSAGFAYSDQHCRAFLDSLGDMHGDVYNMSAVEKRLKHQMKLRDAIEKSDTIICRKKKK